MANYVSTHTGEQIDNGVDIALNNVITKDNTTAFTPSENYHPATKKYVDDNVDTKQEKLVSGTNIRTINNATVLGNGNISIPNTTYSEITEAEITAGTASTARAISGRRMKFALDSRLNGYQIQKNGTDGAGIINFKTV